MNIEVANRLVELRKKNNLSQEALAGKLGVSRQAVSKWERAEASPDTDNLIQLARLYGISLDELLGIGGGNMTPVSETEMQPTEIKESRENRPVIIVEEEPIRINYKALRHFPVFMVVTLVYLIMGATRGGWHPGWLLFFLPPIWYSALYAIERRDARRFGYPLLVVLLYLCLGIFGSLWHPGWILFLTIPMYYPLVMYFQSEYRSQKAELDKLMEENGLEKSRE